MGLNHDKAMEREAESNQQPCDVHVRVSPLNHCRECGQPTAMVCHDCELTDDLPCLCAAWEQAPEEQT